MKKKKWVMLAAWTLGLPLLACSSQEVDNIWMKEEDAVIEAEYEESASAWNDITVSRYEIPIPEGASVSTFCVEGETVYYSLEYTDHLIDQTGLKGNNAFLLRTWSATEGSLSGRIITPKRNGI